MGFMKTSTFKYLNFLFVLSLYTILYHQHTLLINIFDNSASASPQFSEFQGT